MLFTLTDSTAIAFLRSVTSRIKIQYQPCDEVWQVAVNSGELEDAILNMVINARDAMLDNGQLTLTTKNLIIDHESAQSYPGLELREYVRLTISDTGVGINAENIERIFEPFFTTKAEGVGTGLGLAMVYSFVKRSGGIINVQSEPGEGTTFNIYLPRYNLSDETLLIAQEVTSNSPAIQGHGESVLVVDDEESLREVAVNYLARAGYYAT